MIEKELRILLADDDADDCLLFKEALEELTVPVKLTVVRDGEQLMRLLDTNAPYDMLFLDLNMPRKNGFDCLTEIRENKKFDDLAVIAISTSFDQDKVDLLYKNGAQHFIHKPNEFSKLKRLIENGITFVAEYSTQSIKNNIVL